MLCATPSAMGRAKQVLIKKKFAHNVDILISDILFKKLESCIINMVIVRFLDKMFFQYLLYLYYKQIPVF